MLREICAPIVTLHLAIRPHRYSVRTWMFSQPLLYTMNVRNQNNLLLCSVAVIANSKKNIQFLNVVVAFDL